MIISVNDLMTDLILSRVICKGIGKINTFQSTTNTLYNGWPLIYDRLEDSECLERLQESSIGDESSMIPS